MLSNGFTVDCRVNTSRAAHSSIQVASLHRRLLLNQGNNPTEHTTCNQGVHSVLLKTEKFCSVKQFALFELYFSKCNQFLRYYLW